MTFYCITNRRNPTTNKLLRDAGESRGIPVVLLDENELTVNLPPISSTDILYRVSDSQPAKVVEQLLLKKNPASFYLSELGGKFAAAPHDLDALVMLKKRGVPIPKTVFSVSRDRNLLTNTLQKLGGFPAILKALGGSHGVGVMRIDSFPSLFSIVDLLSSRGIGPLILRQYIDVRRSARLVVLGNHVIDSIEYMAPANDFRSNVGAVPNVRTMAFADNIQRTAIRATTTLGWEFGGVDILIDDKDNYYVTEVNFPCFFPRCQLATGVDIAGKMIDYLASKSRGDR